MSQRGGREGEESTPQCLLNRIPLGSSNSALSVLTRGTIMGYRVEYHDDKGNSSSHCTVQYYYGIMQYCTVCFPSSLLPPVPCQVGRSSGLTRGTIMGYGVESPRRQGELLGHRLPNSGGGGEPFDMEGDSGSTILLLPEEQDSPGTPMEEGRTGGRGRGRVECGRRGEDTSRARGRGGAGVPGPHTGARGRVNSRGRGRGRGRGWGRGWGRGRAWGRGEGGAGAAFGAPRADSGGAESLSAGAPD